jgi:hypothetical protein
MGTRQVRCATSAKGIIYELDLHEVLCLWHHAMRYSYDVQPEVLQLRLSLSGGCMNFYPNRFQTDISRDGMFAEMYGLNLLQPEVQHSEPRHIPITEQVIQNELKRAAVTEFKSEWRIAFEAGRAAEKEVRYRRIFQPKKPSAVPQKKCLYCPRMVSRYGSNRCRSCYAKSQKHERRQCESCSCELSRQTIGVLCLTCLRDQRRRKVRHCGCGKVLHREAGDLCAVCYMKTITLPRNHCLTCDVELNRKNITGYCRAHVAKKNRK